MSAPFTPKSDAESVPGKEPNPESAPGEEVSGPEELKIQQAMAFYQEILRMGPRLAREVLAEGKRLGHAKRTQERARSRLNVQKIPPTTWQGPWLIALPGDSAVEAAKQRRKEKEQKRQHQQGNRRRKKPKDGRGSSLHDELLAAAR
jgi:hypothetical protein